MATLSDLSDTFDGAALNTAKWADASNGGVVSVSGGALRLQSGAPRASGAACGAMRTMWGSRTASGCG